MKFCLRFDRNLLPSLELVVILPYFMWSDESAEILIIFGNVFFQCVHETSNFKFFIQRRVAVSLTNLKAESDELDK